MLPTLKLHKMQPDISFSRFKHYTTDLKIVRVEAFVVNECIKTFSCTIHDRVELNSELISDEQDGAVL
jgi:hypothetical protein